MSNSKYIYANGAIKVAETRLLDKSKLAKLFNAKEEDFKQYLIDMGYGNQANNLEGIINSELVKTKQFLDEVNNNNPVIDLFYLQNDAQNIKVIYKSKIFDLDHKDNFVDTGVIGKEALINYIINEKKDAIPEEYLPLLQDIESKVSNLKNARLISAKIDSCVFGFIFKKLEKYNDETLGYYFKLFIDFANIMTLIRSRALNWGLDKFLEMFVEHGTIEQNDFIEAYSLASDGLVKQFTKYSYGEKLAKGLKAYSEDGNLSKFEKFLDELRLKLMKDYSLEFFSVGPLIYYYLEKQAEAKNIRMIYSNKDTEISDLLEY